MRGIACLLVLAMPACSGGIDEAGGSVTDAAPTPEPHRMDMVDMQMLDVSSHVATFKKINTKPYASTLGTFNIDDFVSQDSRDFEKIHPESTGSHVVMPVGTLIVRQVLDANGAVTKVTLMGKGPAGYDPTLGDWWFGVTDPSGTPLSDDTGMQVGRLTQCHGCHIPRAEDDYLFGVPKEDQR